MGSLLGSKTLGLNELELQFVMLANHDQNVLVLFRLAQSICFLCKVGIELLQNLLCNSVWLDRSRIRLDRSKDMQIVEIPNSAQARLTCRVLCFVFKYKRENPSHVLEMLHMLCA